MVFDVPGLQSVARASVTPASCSIRAGGVARPQAERRRRQEHGDHAGVGQGPGVGLVGMHQVVGRQAAQLGRQPGPAGVGQLLGVDAGGQPVAPPRLQHPPGLVDGQRPLVAEGVAAHGQVGAGGQHLVDDEVDVVGGRRQMGAEEGRGPAPPRCATPAAAATTCRSRRSWNVSSP